MKIKRFVAKNMREAIRQVREEQGNDAVILSNRRVNGGIEVVAAVDYDEALMQASLRRTAAQAAASAAATPAAPPMPEKPVVRSFAETLANRFLSAAPPPEPEPAPRSEDALDQLLVEFGDQQPVPEIRTPMMMAAAAAAAATSAAFAEIVPTPGTSSPAANQGVWKGEFQELKDELGGMRRMLEQQLAGLAWQDLKQRRPQRLAVLRALSDIGLEPELARAIADELPESSPADRARFLPLGLLARRIAVTKPDIVLDGGIIALVGPTGVGKTTTIAKLAARYAERHGLRDVALVAMDHYRIGAQEQLYTYGRLLGVPVYSVSPQQSLAETLGRLSDRRLILIDTVGMSPRDDALAGQIAMLGQAHPQLKAYLVMAASCQYADLSEIVRRFGAADLAGCILSKLDESSRIGGVLSAAIRHQLPVAYLADGQRVPEDMHVAAPGQLVVRAMQLVHGTPMTVDEEHLAMQYVSSNDVAVHAHV